MIAELKVAKLLAGFRGKPPADIDALVAAICGLSISTSIIAIF